jgi:hypothetical protein
VTVDFAIVFPAGGKKTPAVGNEAGAWGVSALRRTRADSGLKIFLKPNLLLGALLERGFTAGTGAILQLLTGAFLFAYTLALFQRSIAGRMLCALAGSGPLALVHVAATASGAHALAGTAHAATAATATATATASTAATATFGHRNTTAQCSNQNRNHQHILAHHVLLLM